MNGEYQLNIIARFETCFIENNGQGQNNTAFKDCGIALPMEIDPEKQRFALTC